MTAKYPLIYNFDIDEAIQKSMKLIYLEVRKMTNSQDFKFNAIENTDAIVGIDIAKKCTLGRDNPTEWERN